MSHFNPSLSIAVLASSFFPNVGGAEVTLHNLVKRLQRRGHRPIVLVSFAYWWRLRKSLHRFGYPIIPLLPKQHSWSRKWGEKYLRIQDLYFAYLQRKYRFHVWQSFGAFPVGVGVAHFAGPRGIPHVVRCMGYDVQKRPDIGYGYRLDLRTDRTIKRWAPAFSAMVALTPSVVEDCLDLGVDEKRIRVIPCGVETVRFNNGVLDSRQLRRRYGIPEDVFCFLTVGRYHLKKGFNHLLQAVRLLKERGVGPFHVVFAGRGMEPLQALVREHRTQDMVTFTGEVGSRGPEDTFEAPSGQMIELYRSVDALVFPSLIETFGNVNIEAMAAGIPVITTDAPGCRDIIEPGVTGLVARSGDPQDLADKMARLLCSRELRISLVDNAAREVANKYDWDVVIPKFEQLYFDLVAGGCRGSSLQVPEWRP